MKILPSEYKQTHGYRFKENDDKKKSLIAEIRKYMLVSRPKTRMRDFIEEKGFDEGGYKEALDRTFAPTDNDKLSENGVMADRTMNTLLHVFEAYTELYRVSKDERVKNKLMWILETFRTKIYNPALHRNEVFFDNDMNTLIDLHSFGHDIETAWLLDRGLNVMDDAEYAKQWDAIVADLVQNVYKLAYYNNSFSNECENGVVDTKRVWWVQAEAMVGFYNEYQKHPEKTEYKEAAENELAGNSARNN